MPANIGNYVQDLRLPKNFLRGIRCLRMLDLHGPQGILSVWYLWDYTAEHFPSTGRLEGMSAKDIHLTCNASKESACFVGDLTECGFLRKEDDGTYFLPNWCEEQPHVAQAEARSEVARQKAEKSWESRRKAKTETNQSSGNASAKPQQCSNTNSNTNIKSPPTPPRGGRKRNAPVNEIAELYREILPELPQPEELTEKVRRDIEARWNAKPERQSLEWWRGYFGKVRERPILMGESGKWCASLGWLVNKGCMDKVLGGEYPTRADAERLAEGGASAPKARSYSLEEFELMRAEERAAAEAAGYLDPDMP